MGENLLFPYLVEKYMERVIENMVCLRCVESVSEVANNLQLPVKDVKIGKINFTRGLTQNEISKLSDALEKKGFELVKNRNQEIVTRIKSVLIDYLKHIEATDKPENLSTFLSRNMPYNYSYLSQVFSKEREITIEHYLIHLKIERVKELLEHQKYTLSEIAWKLNYSSVQYLSNQFKSVMGKTVTEYLRQPDTERISLDQL